MTQIKAYIKRDESLSSVVLSLKVGPGEAYSPARQTKPAEGKRLALGKPHVRLVVTHLYDTYLSQTSQ